MIRSEQLQALAEVLQLAAQKARKVALPDPGCSAREMALATQIEGIAMEYRVLASEAPRATPSSTNDAPKDGDTVPAT